MPFTLTKFQSLRPYLYHLTDRRNVDRIKRTGRLLSATRLLNAAKQRGIITAQNDRTVFQSRSTAMRFGFATNAHFMLETQDCRKIGHLKTLSECLMKKFSSGPVHHWVRYLTEFVTSNAMRLKAPRFFV
ncbi:MAG: hypothetical protein QM775_01495 [Pirellulales bacterium]